MKRKIYHHGLSEHPLYKAWGEMKRRCTKTTSVSYKWYGARGISYDERWNDFAVFLEDMGEPPGPGYSLDRVDNNGNYCKENCRWATGKEQARNTRRKKLWEAFGESKTMPEWLEDERCLVDEVTLNGRLYGRKWPVEMALTGSRYTHRTTNENRRRPRKHDGSQEDPPRKDD